MHQQALMTPTVHDTKLRPLFIFGTRPELIKLAPVIRECVRRTADIHAVVCATGQHAEVTRSAQADFGIAVDYDLRVMRRGQSLVSLLSKCLRRVDRVIAAQQPDCVVAQGDTASVLVAAMAAFMRRVPLIHIEAGLRTHDMAAPWPEEWIRRVASLSTTIHCAPTVQAADNLRAEGIPASNVHVTGNTIVDALQWTLSRCPIPKSPAVLSLSPLVLITAHRRENWGFPLARICRAVAAAAAKYPQVSFVFPVHPNPRVRTVVERALGRLDNVQLLAPLCHADFVSLLARSSLVLTDSGGVQEEACSLGKPLLILREETERPEVLAFPRTRLVGTQECRIRREIERELREGLQHTDCDGHWKNPFGDGLASLRIVDLLMSLRRRTATPPRCESKAAPEDKYRS